jgi:hypothetical protein
MSVTKRRAQQHGERQQTHKRYPVTPIRRLVYGPRPTTRPRTERFLRLAAREPGKRGPVFASTNPYTVIADSARSR